MSEDIKKTPEVETPDTSNKVDKEEEISFTEKQQEKVNELISSRLERAEKASNEKFSKLEQKFKKQVEEARKEGERLAKLSADEKEKEVLENQRKENEEREKVLASRENKLEAIGLFSQAGIPIELVDYVVTPDRDKTIENTESFVKNFQKSLEQAIAKKLEGQPPKDVSGETTSKTGMKSAY
jgi:ABC-type branched-subunit amino acid transport system substrate-binding protein